MNRQVVLLQPYQKIGSFLGFKMHNSNDCFARLNV